VVTSLLLGACKKENVQTPPSNNSKAGTFQVRMTDAPGDYEGLFVEIDKVEAYLENKGWVTLNGTSQMVSVLDLTNGNETNIAYNTKVEAGVYSKVRLTFGDENRLKLNSSSEQGLKLGEGMSATGMLDLEVSADMTTLNQVVIEIDEKVDAQTGANVLLDFNVAESIIENESGFILNPIIVNIEDEQTGLRGRIEGAVQAAVMLNGQGTSVSTYIDQNGDFLIRGLKEGTYTMLINAEVDGQNTNEVKTIPSIVIVQGRIQNMGTVNL